MPPDSYVDWGAVHFYTPLNRTGEQILTDEEKSKGLCCCKYCGDTQKKGDWYSTVPIFQEFDNRFNCQAILENSRVILASFAKSFSKQPFFAKFYNTDNKQVP